jgi:hypothetical protein
MINLTGKTIGELSQLNDIPIDALFLIEFSGTTYNTPYSSVQNYSKIISTDDVIYTGANINCLNIKKNMDLTEIIENIGDLFCKVTPSNVLCYQMLFPQPLSGSCQNSLEYLFNQSISSWCIDNPPTIPCTDGLNPLDYILNQSISSYNESNPIIVPCTDGLNPLGYILNQSISNFEPFVILQPCTDGLNPLDYILNQSINNYTPLVSFELCNEGVNPMERIFNTSIMMFNNQN